MEQDLPDWSLLNFLDKGGKSVSGAVGSARDSDGRVVMWLLGVAMVACIFPISLIIFILKNSFRVSTKTWFYFIVMIIIVIGTAVTSLFQ